MGEKNKLSRVSSIDNVVTTILNEKTYGDELSYTYLENLLECDKTDIAFFYIICNVRDKLIANGYVLKNLMNEGYRILYPNEIADEVVRKYIVQSNSKLEVAKRIMEHTEMRLLNSQERELFKHIQLMVNKELANSTNTLTSAMAVLNNVKQKELSK